MVYWSLQSPPMEVACDCTICRAYPYICKFTRMGFTTSLTCLLGPHILSSCRILWRNRISNPVPLHEWFFYVFDASPMALAALALSVVHAGLVLKGPGSEFPSLDRKEKKEVKKIVRQAQKDAKARGVGLFGGWTIARHVKRGKLYRRAAERNNTSCSERCCGV